MRFLERISTIIPSGIWTGKPELSFESKSELRAATSTIDRAEIKQFEGVTFKEWIDLNGPMKGLHQFNYFRVPFIMDMYTRSRTQGPLTSPSLILAKINGFSLSVFRKSFFQKSLQDLDFSGLKVLDVGAGGGILTKQLADLGADVTAMEPEAIVCKAASEHYIGTLNIKYCDAGIGDDILTEDTGLTKEKKHRPFDIVVASEVIEHTAEGTAPAFMKELTNWVRPKGLVVITAPNRTFLSRISLIYIGEYILKLLPKGSHHYKKFIKAKTVQRIMMDNHCSLVGYQSIVYIPGRTGRFIQEPTGRFNYAFAFRSES